MNIEEVLPYSLLIVLTIVSYLFISSILIGFNVNRRNTGVFFALAGVSLSISVFFKVFNSAYWISEFTSLLIWPTFFLYLVSHKRAFKLQWSLLLHILIPFGWLVIVSNNLLVEIESGFNFVYLISIIGYGWSGIYEASKLRKLKEWNKNYMQFLFIGLIIAISLRFVLPIFLQSVDTYTLYFHVFISGYFIMLSSFYYKAPIMNSDEQMAAIQLDEAINYEEELKRKLKHAMVREKAFLNPELTLNELADRLGIKSTELSNFINTNLGKNFNDFVNEYRVEEVKNLMTNAEKDQQATIIELAYEAGFNSKASFNRIFKQVTQMTPSQFKKSHQQLIQENAKNN